MSLPQARPGSTGSIKPVRPAAAHMVRPTGSHLGREVWMGQERPACEHTNPMYCSPSAPIHCAQHFKSCCDAGAQHAHRQAPHRRTCQGVEVRQRGSLQRGAPAQLRDRHIAHSIYEHKGHPLRLSRRRWSAHPDCLSSWRGCPWPEAFRSIPPISRHVKRLKRHAGEMCAAPASLRWSRFL